jgi:hypothetical protein
VVYDESAFPLVESVIKGYNGTIFAYGQTGCGKTHTMMGVPSDPKEAGIIPNCFSQIFGFIDEKEKDMRFLVRCSYLEIYQEGIHDLLAEGAGKKNHVHKKMELKEDPEKGVFVKDLTQGMVKSIPEIEKAMTYGTANRKVASTAMNADSSRSHSIFTIYIESAEWVGGEQRIKAGKLHLVDLAGSERSGKTGATGQTQKEGIKINLSLTALGNVIQALVEGKSTHIPYRDSKLTRLLQDSLGGNQKTVMIAALSPADYNYDETASTLRYASRAKSIKNKPIVNEDPKDALLKQYEDEITKLKRLLEQMKSGGSAAINPVELGSWVRSQSIKMSVTAEDKPDNADESVATLIAKLNSKGTKVKILKEGDDEVQPTPPARPSKSPAKTSGKPAQQSSKKRATKRSSSDKENSGVRDELKSPEQMAREGEEELPEQLGAPRPEPVAHAAGVGNEDQLRELEQLQKQSEEIVLQK